MPFSGNVNVVREVQPENIKDMLSPFEHEPAGNVTDFNDVQF